jgi:hypothetical protein
LKNDFHLYFYLLNTINYLNYYFIINFNFDPLIFLKSLFLLKLYSNFIKFNHYFYLLTSLNIFHYFEKIHKISHLLNFIRALNLQNLVLYYILNLLNIYLFLKNLKLSFLPFSINLSPLLYHLIKENLFLHFNLLCLKLYLNLNSFFYIFIINFIILYWPIISICS